MVKIIKNSEYRTFVVDIKKRIFKKTAATGRNTIYSLTRQNRDRTHFYGFPITNFGNDKGEDCHNTPCFAMTGVMIAGMTGKRNGND